MPSLKSSTVSTFDPHTLTLTPLQTQLHKRNLLIMEEKRKDAYQPYADEEHVGQLPFSLPIAQRPQQGQSILKRIFYGFIFVVAVCSLTLIACRHTMAIRHDSTTELPVAEVQLGTSLDLDNETLTATGQAWEVQGFADESCTGSQFVRILGFGRNADLQTCKPMDSTVGVRSVMYYGYQEYPAYGACIYEGADCGRNNAWTTRASRVCVTLARPGAANRFFVKRNNEAC
ncbi:hypothetical protein ACHAPV_001878 [Trichoderma viride]